MADNSPFDKPPRAAILAVALCALLIRAAVVVAMADSLAADPDAYRRIAENLRQHGVYGSSASPTAFRPPLYPVLLAGLAVNGSVTSTAVGGLHVLCGVATVVLTLLLAHRWHLGRWSYGAAALVALDPILLNQSALVMTETLATLLATAGLFALSAAGAKPSLPRAMIAGLVVGLACLCRPTFLPWLGLSTLAMLFPPVASCARRGQPRTSRDATGGASGAATWFTPSSVGCAITFFVSATLVISPWVIRNYFVFGVPKATTTHGGYTVLLGNNPSFYHYLREAPWGSTWDSAELASAWELRRFSTSPRDPMWQLPTTPTAAPRTAPRVRTEFEDDQFAYSLARCYMADEPAMAVLASLVRVNRLWQILPYQTSDSESTARRLMRFVTACWYSVLFLLAIVAVYARRRELLRSPLVWGVLLCFSFTAVHALYWSNMRMRAPLMPLVCLLAAQGAAQVSARVRDRKP